MGNAFHLIGPRKSTGNRVSVPLFSDVATNPFIGPVPLTSDLEPDRSDYFTIPTFAGKFPQSLLVPGNSSFLREIVLIVSILCQFVSLRIQYRLRIDGK